MGPLVALLGMFGLMVLWVFYNFQPKHAEKKQLRAYNLMVAGVCAFLCLMFALNIEVALSNTINEKYALPIALGGAILIEIVFLLIGFIARNFWIFNPRRRRRF